METQVVMRTLVVVQCGVCDILFGLSQAKYDRCFNTGEGFFCPNGHNFDTYYNNCVAGHLCGVRLIGRKPAAPAPPPAAVAPAPLRMPDGRPYLVTER